MKWFIADTTDMHPIKICIQKRTIDSTEHKFTHNTSLHISEQTSVIRNN